MELSIDHVILCVPDLDEGTEWLTSEHGLHSIPGGRHQGWGTANRIVPLGSAYLELLAVVDAEEARSNPFGRWALECIESAPYRPVGLCLRCDRIEEMAERHHLELGRMSRIRPDGTTLSWVLAGLETALPDGLPFYIRWEVDPALHPGVGGDGQGPIEEVVMSGDRELLATRVGDTAGVRVVPGEPGVGSVRVRRGTGSVVF